MKQTQIETYLGTGYLFLDGHEVGLVSQADYEIEVEKKELKNPGPGGGIYKTVERISKVMLKITSHNINQRNLAIALRGQVEEGEATAVKDKVLGVIEYGMIETPSMIDTTKKVTVKKGEGDVEIPETESDGTVNYIVRPAGILTKSEKFVGVKTVKVGYTPRKRNILEALVNSGKEFRVLFDGVNEAESGKPSVVRTPRFKPALTDKVSLVGEDFSTLNLSGEVLADLSQPPGKSQFFTREDAA